MSLLETVKMALSALAQNRGRSVLTVLSITVGAFAIVLMSSLAESALTTMMAGIEDIGGARILLVVPKTPERGQAKQFAYARGVTLADRDRLERDLPHVESLTLYSSLGDVEVLAESGAKATTSLVAADARFLQAMKMNLARGRAFTDEENRGRSAFCVVGSELAEKVGPAESAPLGGFLTVGQLRCRVIGVLAKTERFGANFGFDVNNLVVTPSEAMADLDPSVALGAMLFVKTDSKSANDIVKRVLNARLVARHPGVDDFTFLDFAGIMTTFERTFAGMELLVALLAGIALFVGGVGVLNMMLVAVSERVKEIGVRKALGAPPRAIGAQFLSEAILLSTLGGGAGVVLGLASAIGASALIGHFLKSWQTSLAPWAPTSALIVTIGLGVVFGWAPAKRAAALAPVEAMRR
jgi:putative ABC transport system permease protein